MRRFALLWGKMLRSSLWVKESKETRLVWVTMLMLMDEEGRVFSSEIGLADSAKVTPEECREALKILTSPDPDDTSKVEEGVRLRTIHGGWQIINFQIYAYSSDEKREFWRQQKAAQRARLKKKDCEPSLEMGEKDMEEWAERGISPPRKLK
jgi:hypothetical protein